MHHSWIQNSKVVEWLEKQGWVLADLPLPVQVSSIKKGSTVSGLVVMVRRQRRWVQHFVVAMVVLVLCRKSRSPIKSLLALVWEGLDLLLVVVEV